MISRTLITAHACQVSLRPLPLLRSLRNTIDARRAHALRLPVPSPLPRGDATADNAAVTSPPGQRHPCLVASTPPVVRTLPHAYHCKPEVPADTHVSVTGAIPALHAARAAEAAAARPRQSASALGDTLLGE